MTKRRTAEQQPLPSTVRTAADQEPASIPASVAARSGASSADRAWGFWFPESEQQGGAA